jgi:hypothetical protein
MVRFSDSSRSNGEYNAGELGNKIHLFALSVVWLVVNAAVLGNQHRVHGAESTLSHGSAGKVLRVAKFQFREEAYNEYLNQHIFYQKVNLVEKNESD